MRAIIRLFFSIFFPSSISDGKFIPSQLYLFIKKFDFFILSECFPILHNLMGLLHRIENIYYLFCWLDLLLLSCFSSNQESLCFWLCFKILVISSLFSYRKILTASQVSMILDFIQNLKSLVKIHLKPQWVRRLSVLSLITLFSFF